MKKILAPSILSADFKTLGEQIIETEKGGAQYIHFDIMDGMFVPSISFGMPVLSSIRNLTGQTIDAHLMVTEPVRLMEEFVECGADILTIHYEACTDIKADIDCIHSLGVKAGLSIKPETPVETLEPYLEQADMFLVMCVVPGFGGQTFLPGSIEKIQKLRAMLRERGMEKDIEVDGGIHHSNVTKVLDAGANIIVAGSAIYKGDVRDNTERFMEILRNYD